MSDQTLYYFMLVAFAVQTVCLFIMIVFMALSAWNMRKVDQIQKEIRRISDEQMNRAVKQSVTFSRDK